MVVCEDNVDLSILPVSLRAFFSCSPMHRRNTFLKEKASNSNKS
jgi:hypothetical protein